VRTFGAGTVRIQGRLSPSQTGTHRFTVLLTLRSRLLATLIAMSFVAAVGLAIPFVTTNALLGDLATRSTAAVRASAAYISLTQALSDQETGLRGYLLTSDNDFLAPYNRGRAAEDAALAELDGATADRADLRALILDVRSAADRWRSDYALKVIDDLDNDRLDDAGSAASLRRGKVFFDQLRDALAALGAPLASPDAVLTTRLDQLLMLRMTIFSSIIVALVVTLVVAAVLLRRWVSQPLLGLVKTARLIEQGEDARFPMGRRDELGDLAAALERMRQRIRDGQELAEAAAAESSVLNRFTELTAFATTDVLVAEATLTALAELSNPDDGVVHVSNHSRDRATADATVGGAPAETLTLGALGTCPGVRRSSTYVTQDLAAPLAVRCPVYPIEAGTLACVPLIANGETIGAVHLHWRTANALSLEDRSFVGRIAEHAALTVGNRRLVAALQGMASTDARTGLANIRAFDEAIETALGRPGQNAVLLLDLDHFKQFNDRFGHPAGDEALRVFGGILQSCVREGDLAARYGGEEFAVLLAGQDRAQAATIAERIRARTEATIVSVGPGVTARITCSVGVAVSPDDGGDRMRLLQTADRALYRAKEGGRNRVVTTADGPLEVARPAPAAADASPTRLPVARARRRRASRAS
jgi:diguanylate cyclase (GGDEF)-like protein